MPWTANAILSLACRSLTEKPEMPQFPNVCSSCSRFHTAKPPVPHRVRIADLEEASALVECVWRASILDADFEQAVGDEGQEVVMRLEEREDGLGQILKYSACREGHVRLGGRWRKTINIIFVFSFSGKLPNERGALVCSNRNRDRYFREDRHRRRVFHGVDREEIASVSDDSYHLHQRDGNIFNPSPPGDRCRLC